MTIQPLNVAALACAAALLAVVASGCASSSSRTAAVSRPTAGPSRAATPPPGCALALAALPAAPPLTTAQATADQHGLFAVAIHLAGPVHGTPVSERASALGTESFLVGLGLGLPGESKNVAAWQRDAQSLRAYCAS